MYNSTFFCDATASFCYSYVTTPANFSAAAASCTSLGGYLVKYDSGHLQFDVESYLNTTGALTPYYYWIGIARQNINGSYVYVSDGSSLPQSTSNTPYAHWSWRQPVSAAQRGFDCVIAQGQFAYDIYLGGEAAKQQTDAAYYTIDHPMYPSRKHGWNAQSCNASYPYVCQIPGASFTCYPPPSPTPPPPSPPPPPMPPAPKTGVLRRDLLCHFAGGVALCGASVVLCLLWPALHLPAVHTPHAHRPPDLLPPAAAPASNSTFFCDYQGVKCYSHSFLSRGFQAAQADCTSRGGELVQYGSAAEQHLVESYFRNWKSLAKNYWHGVSRPAEAGSPFALLDGSVLPQTPSLTPYAHWGFNQPLFVSKQGYDCGAAFADNAFSIYQGSGTSSGQLTNPGNYAATTTVNDAFNNYGWAGYDCSASMRFVCMILASNFHSPPPPATAFGTICWIIE